MPAIQVPTRLPKGVTNVTPTDPWHNIGYLDETKWIRQHNDFLDYQATQWLLTVTEAGAGSAAVTNVTAGVDGILQILNDDANADAVFMQWSGVDSATTTRTFLFTPGQQLGYKCRFKVDSVALASVICGLSVVDTTPLAVATDNAVFRMTTATSVMNFVCTVGGVEQVLAVQTMVSDTYYDFAYYWNGRNFQVYVDGRKVGTVEPSADFSTAPLCQTMGIQNGSAVARTMSIDYFSVIKQRVISY